MKSVIVTGAAGFVGFHLTKTLSEHGYQVYAVVRPESEHNNRIKNLPGVKLIEADIENIDARNYSSDLKDVLAGSSTILKSEIPNACDYFFHLIWKPADRYDYPGQMKSGYLALCALVLAASLGCKRFVGIGSQAEYGVYEDIIREDETPVKPFCGYGAAKVAACEFTRRRAQELGIEWVWGRIFSIFGEHEPESRLLPHLLDMFIGNVDVRLSSCRQKWDFLYGSDAGEAILSIAEKGRDGEIYNIADGRYRPLKDYVETLHRLCNSKSSVIYGDDPKPFVSLQPSMEKLMKDTGWKPKVSFEEGISKRISEHNDT